VVVDFEQLASFVAVARHRSFTLASRERALSQPGISRQIQKIERELGISLLERDGVGVRLTTAGERFLAYAQSAVDEHARVVAEVRGTIPQLVGNLRIVASTTPGAYLVPALVARFEERHPKVRAEVAIADSTEVIAAVKGGRWDVGFTGAQSMDRSLRQMVVAEDEIVLAVPRHHAFARRDDVSLAELADLPFIEREEGSGTLQSLRLALSQRNLVLPPRRVVMVLSSCQAIIAAVQQGLGVGFVSSLALDRSTASGVVGVRIAEVPTLRRLYLIHGDRSPLSPVAAAFVSFVEQRNTFSDTA
jgi:DNA-binding transcriptional LysR family regulator